MCNCTLGHGCRCFENVSGKLTHPCLQLVIRFADRAELDGSSDLRITRYKLHVSKMMRAPMF